MEGEGRSACHQREPEGGDTSTAQVICHTLREKTKEEGKYSTTCIPTTLLVDLCNLCPIQHLFIGTTN